MHDAREVFLWPGAAPGTEGAAFSEKVEERAADNGCTDHSVYGISRPSMFPAPAPDPCGAAVLVIPGGGYERVVMDKEGMEIAAWLNALGVGAFVLKYRLPAEGHRRGPDVPLMDAQRAMRLIRRDASLYGVDPARIGVMGFSAGGHLAAELATRWDADHGLPDDGVNRLDARPDFAALIYPVISMEDGVTHAGSRKMLLGNSPGESAALHSADLNVSPRTPRCFLAHSAPDGSVPVENSLRFARALIAAGVPVELHVFADGGHGFGLRSTAGTQASWPELFRAWLGPQSRPAGGAA